MGAFYSPIKDGTGNVVGIWIADPDMPNLAARLQMFAVADGLAVEVFAALSEGRYRKVPNTADGRGGAFLMLGNALAPGEKPSLRRRK